MEYLGGWFGDTSSVGDEMTMEDVMGVGVGVDVF